MCATPPATGELRGDLEGELRWGVRRSFVEYVAALPDGLVTPTEAQPPYRFRLAGPPEHDARRSLLRLRFAGAVAFRGHWSMLAVDIVDPWLEIGSTSELSIAGPAGSDRRISLARWGAPEVEESTGATIYRAPAPELTFEGSHVFGEIYPLGTVLDPIEVTLARGREPGSAASPGKD